jgi:hypothetical protein
MWIFTLTFNYGVKYPVLWWRLLVRSVTVKIVRFRDKMFAQHTHHRPIVRCMIVCFVHWSPSFVILSVVIGNVVNSYWHLCFCSVDWRAYNRVAGLKQNILSPNPKALKFKQNVKLRLKNNCIWSVEHVTKIAVDCQWNVFHNHFYHGKYFTPFVAC